MVPDLSGATDAVAECGGRGSQRREGLGLTRSDGQVGCGDHAAWGVAVG